MWDPSSKYFLSFSSLFCIHCVCVALFVHSPITTHHFLVTYNDNTYKTFYGYHIKTNIITCYFLFDQHYPLKVILYK